MKTYTLSRAAFVIMLLAVIGTSCKKSEQKQTGDLKVTNQVTPKDPNGNTRYFVSDKVELDLYGPAGNLIATQYADPSSTIDLGTYNYDSYSITAKCQQYGVNMSTGGSSGPYPITNTIKFQLDQTTKTVTVVLDGR